RITVNGAEFEIEEIKQFRLKLSRIFTTSSPIVLYKNNLTNEYFSFKRDGALDFFINRLKENALKKYRAYYNEDIEFEENIFDRLVFRKEVAVNIYKNGVRFIIIGSMWKMIEKFNIDPAYKKFYSFLMDCGLGEKNSLGFGFINPVKFK
ncbi:MAG: CRISPR-associated endoribonuclease Cas6, partial [Nitrososphaeria archaeon]